MNDIIYYTYSFCPECLRETVAEIISADGEVYLRKKCPEHGEFMTLIWQDDAEAFLEWMEAGGIDVKDLPRSVDALERKRNYRCRLEPSNGKQPTTAALMVTAKCNLSCPVCFTKSMDGKEAEPSLEELKRLLDNYKDFAGEGAPLEFCGGEPTTRPDIFQLAEYARSVGFDYIQLNTNGIRLAGESDYCRKLKDSGITTVYLGFDGIDDNVYRYKYSADLFDTKREAIKNCVKAGLAIVLVPCIIPGVNDDQLGAIIRIAKEGMPSVKGVYFQPISYFGCYPSDGRQRITIPEIMRRIESQTGGEINASDFLPGNYEHPLCSFQGIFLKDRNNSLKALTRLDKRQLNEHNFIRIRNNAKYLWSESNQSYLTIGGMAFQDVWNYDSQRTGRCSIQIIGRNGSLVPLCAKYLTSAAGRRVLHEE